MKIYVVHNARRDRYRDDEIDSTVYYASVSEEKARAERDRLSNTPGGPWYADITALVVDMDP